MESGSDDKNEQAQETAPQVISGEVAPLPERAPSQQVPQSPPRPVVVPQSLPKIKESAKAPAVQKPASPKRMREETNVTENQIVQLPPGLNIFKNSELLKDISTFVDI